MKSRYRELLAVMLSIMGIGLLMLVEPALASIWENQPEIGRHLGEPHVIAKHDMHFTAAVPSALDGACEVYAVDLIGAWVDAGAEEGSFPFESLNENACIGDFEADVLSLFTESGAWFEGSEACTDCHFDNSEDSRHEMDLSSLEGIMRGGDVLSEPPGVAIVIPGDWDNSKLRARLRNNRMPPGWEFDIEETNRDGPLLELDGGEVYAVDLIAAWVNAGIPEGEFTWVAMDDNEHSGDFDSDVLPLFTTDNIWFEGSEACINCHFDNSEDSRHEMDLSSYEGVMMGGDVLSEPPGVPIVVSGDWDASKLKARLRNNRMPPGWEFDIEETNRDGPVVLAGQLAELNAHMGAGETAVSILAGDCGIYAVDLIGAWVNAGAEAGEFPFNSANEEACIGDFEADVLPLFTEDNAWFEGSEACINCHFDNSEDSRHEMDMSSLEGIMRGGDVLSEPPGVPIVIPGDWDASKLRARLRNNRMPPGWEFDIEETNRDGPLLELDGSEIYAVDLIAAWVNDGIPDGEFTWLDMDETEHTGDFDADVLPLFTTDNIWFEGSESCTNCHFDNSEDSRHEMDMSSYEGIMRGGDVLSEPPGVPIVVSGDWDASKLKARLRNNRMPPGWEFDIEETNRDGPFVMAGRMDGMDAHMGVGETAVSVLNGDCDIYAVDLIGAWVDSGAEAGAFPFESVNSEACTGDFETDVLSLFTEDNAWFEGSEACINCHFDNSEDSRHEMDLSSPEGIMRGGDVLSEPPGVAIVIPGDWDASKLRERLRNNRMPPGWEFDIEETNRDGPLLELDGGEIYAVDLIAAWVNAGIPDGEFTWMDMAENEHTGDFDADVLPLFTTDNIWFEGSESCINCHFDNSEDSRHEMDLSSYEGIMMGGDVLSEPPGVPIVVSGDWDASKLKARLRNNRMPPGWEFDIEETNRDGPLVSAGVNDAAGEPHTGGGPATAVLFGECDTYAVDLIGAWVDAGADAAPFLFTSADGQNCQAEFETDVLPLFTEDNAWFEGSESCINCHFDNSEDSRHEMDLSSLAGIMRGGDVLSEPPGVAIVIPGDWDASKLRARLRNNRMPPGWEFDIEETNRDGPLMEMDGGEIYAVDLIAAWVNGGIPDGEFSWIDMAENEHIGDFDADVLPLFTTDNIWFEGSESCTNCHFDNSEDSRHEMDLSSYEGFMMGGDVLSEPPGVPIVVSGDWDASKLKARLRNNRMPPGWEFDIEETNRDGPMVQAGIVLDGAVVAAVNGAIDSDSPDTSELVSEAPEPPPLPDPVVTETIQQANYSIMFLVLFGGITLVFGIGMAFVFGNNIGKSDDNVSKTVFVLALVFAIFAVITAALLLHGLETGTFTKTVTVEIDSPFAVEVAPVIPAVAEVRVEEWQAKIPDPYAKLENPYAGDLEAAQLGQMVFDSHDCYECHGETLQGDGNFSAGLMPKPVNLTDPQLMNLPFMTDTYLFWRISEGGSHAPFLSAMPAWKNTIPEDERWQLVAYIRSQASDVAVDEGEQAAIAIIEQNGCFACHRLDHIGRGGKIGPAWSELPEVAASRQEGMSAADYVRQSIIDPASFIVPGYEEASVMTPDFAEKLSEEEIDMLVEYLLGLPDD